MTKLYKVTWKLWVRGELLRIGESTFMSKFNADAFAYDMNKVFDVLDLSDVGVDFLVKVIPHD